MPPSWVGGLALLGAGLVYDALLARVRRVDRAYPSTDPAASPWWFGYVRDGTNLTGVGLTLLAFLLLDFPGPLAVLAGALTAMTIYMLDYALGRVLSLERAGVALAVVVVVEAVSLFALRTPLRDGLTRLMVWLYA